MGCYLINSIKISQSLYSLYILLASIVKLIFSHNPEQFSQKHHGDLANRENVPVKN